MKKYKLVRNKCNRLIRRDSEEANAKKICSSSDPSTVWKGVRDLMNPRSNETVRLKVDGVKGDDEARVAEHFNKFFMNKVNTLHDN